MTENEMAAVLAASGWGNARRMLVEYIRAAYREVCELCTPACPFISANVFESVCKAIEAMDDAEVEALLLRLSELGDALVQMKKLVDDVQIVIVALPQIWGGNMQDEVTE